MKKFIVILLLCPSILMGQSQKKIPFEKDIEEIVTKSKAAGATVLVAEKGKILLNRGYGFAHLGLGVKAGAETKYYAIGPGTFILGAAIMQQVEKGNLSLDDELTKFLPDFPTQGKRITVRHLLSSTSGIPDYHYLGDPIESQMYQPLHSDQLLQLFTGKTLLIEPGSQFDWSISNFAILTAILEKVAGKSYAHYLQDNFISPLSLQNTHYYRAKQLIKNYAQGYTPYDSGISPAQESLERYDPSMRLVTTTMDLYTMWEALRNGKLVSPASFRMMTDTTESKKNNSGTYIYTLRYNKQNNLFSVGASGGLDGYSSYFQYFPEQKRTIIVLTNTAGEAKGIGDQIVRTWNGVQAATPVQQESKANFSQIPVTPEEQKQITGTYVIQRALLQGTAKTYNTYRRTLRIISEHNQLYLQYSGELPVPLYKQADNTYYLPEMSYIRIAFDSSGAVPVIIMTYGRFQDKGQMAGAADAKTFQSVMCEELK